MAVLGVRSIQGANSEHLNVFIYSIFLFVQIFCEQILFYFLGMEH